VRNAARIPGRAGHPIARFSAVDRHGPQADLVEPSAPEHNESTIPTASWDFLFSFALSGSIYDLAEEAAAVRVHRRLHERVRPIMNLSEMFGDDDPRTFEERRAEVVAIVRSASDFAGADRGLQALFLAMSEADNEQEFSRAFDTLVSSLSKNTARYLQTA
jgi:hypothetical protein